ncbi:MAG: hypothetical protein AB1567_10230 [bacterium]
MVDDEKKPIEKPDEWDVPQIEPRIINEETIIEKDEVDFEK